nr:hypothetical protein [Tanacetum cinerariifolium]
NPQQALKDKGVIDSGCSKHMIGNMSYLSNFEELHGGYVTFGGNPKGGKITGKDLLLPIPFWAEAINTACYVQNRVLVTKPHNKTHYELLHDRLPSIGFMRPFVYPVTILNTLDPLGKFQRKVNEGFLVGYSVCSKSFRVFNSRTRIIQETLHVNFIENKPNVTGSGPAWLFDIDSLSQTMNYHPVIAENQTNSNASFPDTEKAREEGTQTYKYVSPDIHSSSSGAQTRKQGDKTKNKDKGKSLVVTIIGFRDLNAKLKECNNNSSNGVNAASSLVSTAGQNSINSTNDFSAAGPSNVAMPNLEDLSHSNDADDVVAEADINNMESIISIRSMARAVRDQGGISQMFNKDFHTCMFACFLLQEKPKRVHQALKDPSWIEAMQEKLLQFKMQKVWILVDLPYGKRAIGTKWVYINKKDERGIVIRNKARLVAQGHTQEEGIDYEEVKQKKDGIFISQDKYVAEILRKFRLFEGKLASTPIDAEKPLLKDSYGEDVDVHTYSQENFRYLKGKPYLGVWYLKDSPFNLVAYSDSDYAGASLDRKSTTEGCQFLGCRSISWQCKKQIVVATSLTEAEYIAAASGCCYLRIVVIEIDVLNILSDALSITTNDAAEGFEQIIDFLSGSYIHYAVTLSPHIYISCIKQFWKSVSVKRSGDVTSLVRNVDNSSKFYMYPRFIQLIIQAQVGDLSTHTTLFISPALTQKVFANMRRVRKGFSGVETPFFEGMIADRQPAEEELGAEQVQVDTAVAAAVVEDVVEDVAEDVAHMATPSPPPHGILSPPQEPSLPPQQPHVTPSAPTQGEAFPRLEIVKLKARVKKLEKTDKVKSSKFRRLRKVGASRKIESSDDMEDVFNQGRMMNEDEGIKLVKDAEIAESEGRQADKQAEIYNIDLDHSSKVLSMQEDDSEVQEVVEVVTTAKLITEVVTAAATQAVAAYTRRRKEVIIRDLEEELSLKTSVETPKDKGKGIMIKAPKPIKKKDQIEMDAEYARKLQEEIDRDHDRFNKDVDWDAAMDHEMESEDQEIIKSINETPAQKAAKRRKLSEEAQEAEDLRKRLEVVKDEDDVFVEATPLASKVPVVDYHIVLIDNKPSFKIIRADETHHLYISFATLLKNFDREDLETL